MKIYTEEHRKFFLDFVPGHTDVEVAEEFNRRFDVKITPAEVHAYKVNHRLKSGTKRPKGFGSIFPPEVREFLCANNAGKTCVEITELVNSTFGTEYTVGQIKAIRSRMHIKSGLTGYFEKGHVPYNKAHVGDEAWTTDGYLKVKIAEPNVWRFKHIMEWEKHNGKVSDGCCIIFKDGDHNNCNIENLMCITRAEHWVLNAQSLRSCSPEITETGLALTRLKMKIREIERKKE